MAYQTMSHLLYAILHSNLHLRLLGAECIDVARHSIVHVPALCAQERGSFHCVCIVCSYDVLCSTLSCAMALHPAQSAPNSILKHIKYAGSTQFDDRHWHDDQ